MFTGKRARVLARLRTFRGAFRRPEDRRHAWSGRLRARTMSMRARGPFGTGARGRARTTPAPPAITVRPRRPAWCCRRGPLRPSRSAHGTTRKLTRITTSKTFWYPLTAEALGFAWRPDTRNVRPDRQTPSRRTGRSVRTPRRTRGTNGRCSPSIRPRARASLSRSCLPSKRWTASTTTVRVGMWTTSSSGRGREPPPAKTSFHLPRTPRKPGAASATARRGCCSSSLTTNGLAPPVPGEPNANQPVRTLTEAPVHAGGPPRRNLTAPQHFMRKLFNPGRRLDSLRSP